MNYEFNVLFHVFISKVKPQNKWQLYYYSDKHWLFFFRFSRKLKKSVLPPFSHKTTMLTIACFSHVNYLSILIYFLFFYHRNLKLDI